MTEGFKGFSFKKRKINTTINRASAFSNRQDDGEDFDKPSNDSKNFDRAQANLDVKKAQKKLQTDRKSQMLVQQALEHDDEIFEYDTIHDKISSTKLREQIEEEKKVKNCNNKAPKYIQGLMKTAAKRNLESERRYERKAVKDRKDEDHLFADKEKFVTPAFKVKMAKLEKAEQEEMRMDAIDDMHDVTKQQDISGFYRHFLNDNYKNPTDTLRKMTGQPGNIVKKENTEEMAKTGQKKTEDSPPGSTRKRHDSSSSESGSDVSSNFSGGSNEAIGENENNDDQNGIGLGTPAADENPELKQLKSRFAIPKNVPGLTLLQPTGSDSLTDKSQPGSTTGDTMKGFAPASTSYSKISTRSKVTAGGAGIETEIDYDYQLHKLRHIFRKKLSAEDVEAAKRRFHQRNAMREAKGGWAKVLAN